MAVSLIQGRPPQSYNTTDVKEDLEKFLKEINRMIYMDLSKPVNVSDIDIKLADLQKISLPMSITGKTAVIPNKGGFATAVDNIALDALCVDISAQSERIHVVEIGPGYGRLTNRLLLEKMDIIITLIDSCAESLLYCASQLPQEHKEKVTLLNTKDITEIKTEAAYYVIINRVAHFLDEANLNKMIESAYASLKPGGKLFMAQLSPYNGSYRDKVLSSYSKTVEEIYDERSKTNEWPGRFLKWSEGLPEQAYNLPDGTMHLISEETLTTQLIKAGFNVEKSGYYSASAYDQKRTRDDKSNSWIIAVKLSK